MMKRILMTIMAVALAALTMSAQNSARNYALIDMQYILGQIPEHKNALEAIESQAKKWTEEIQGKQKQAQELYVAYQKGKASMSANERAQRENKIVELEDQAMKLQEKYFGREGEAMKLQEKLIKPFQDKIYEAVKLISKRRGYAIVFDRASTVGSIIYADPDADISNDVLAVLGYSN